MHLFSKLLFCAAAICLFTGFAHADVSVVALTGQAAPGVSGAFFSSLSRASVNSSEDIAFNAGLSNGAQGIFKLSHGQLSLVALSGQAIAGSSGLSFGAMGDPIINDLGAIAFAAYVKGEATQTEGAFIANGASIKTVLDATTPIPGTGGQTISLIRNLCFNNSGEIAASIQLTGNGGTGILTVLNGVISPLIPNATNSFSLNNAGDIAFLGMDGGIHLLSGGTTQLVAQSGQSVPNTTLVLSTLQSPALSDQGEIVFVNGIPVGRFNNSVSNAIIKWSAGTLQIIALDGDPVPGIAGATWYGNFNTPVIDDTGRIFFVSRISTDDSNGIFNYVNGNFTLLVREGQTLEGVGIFTFIGEPDANSGKVTFVSNMDNGIAGIFQLNVPYQVFFPDVADGASDPWAWRTTLMLSNPDNSGPASILIAFIQEDGTPMNVGILANTNSQFSFIVPPSGSIQIETTGAGNLKVGWARVQTDKKVSGVSIFSSYDMAGNYISEVGAPSASPLNSFSLFVEAQTNINTGIAFANPNSSSVQATLTLKDAQGTALGSPINLTIPANGHIQKYVTELFQGIVPPDFHGTLEVVSQLPIIAINLRQRGQAFTWLPLIPSL